MRQSCLRLPLLLASSLLVQTAWAQRVAVEPLAPVQEVAAPSDVAKALGQSVPAKVPLAASQPTPAPSQTWPVMAQPLYLVNSGIIVGNLTKIRPQDIANIEVYKGVEPAPGWRAAAPGGIINLTLKPGVKLHSVSLAKLKRRQHLTGLVKFELDGWPLADTALRIATTAIEELVVRRAEDDKEYKVLNIKLVPWKSEPSQHQPGTIMIRGVAGR